MGLLDIKLGNSDNDGNDDENRGGGSNQRCGSCSRCLETKESRYCLYALLGICALLLIILLPLTFSYVEYYEYGLKKRKTTGSVDTDEVYRHGRYANGPDYTFIKYQADAHFVDMGEVSVFSAGATEDSIGLSFVVDVDLTYLLVEKDVGLLHQDLASSYKSVVESRAREAIKNEASSITFTEYFQQRKDVERRFREAVETKWNTEPPLHIRLDQFHLGRIQIPDSVARKQLDSRIQNERNDREKYKQEAQLEREKTAVEVNEIQLEKAKVLRTARAEANLLLSKAESEAKQIMADAQNNGTMILFQEVGIEEQEHKVAYSYSRALANRHSLDLNVEYIPANRVVPTQEL